MNLKLRQAGLTLPELMVAILLGTIITGAVLAMYLSTSRNFRQDESYALMQENGRYALRVLSEDLTMTDFWGRMTATDAFTTALAAAGHCGTGTVGAGTGIDLFDGDTALLYNNKHVGGTPLFPATWPCSQITAVQRTNTPILALKRVQGVQLAAGPADDTVRLRTNGVAGSFIDDNSWPPTPAGFSDWLYRPRIYFIRSFFQTAGDGIPSLCRMELVGDPLSMGTVTNFPDGVADQVTCLAEGIEDFHVQFGIDTDADGIANQYLSSPTLAQIEGVVSARIYVLARASDPDPSHTDAKTFALGDVNLTQANLTGTNFYRRVFSTTVMMRNPVNLNLLNN
jgi:type IV pilus assembly protein PilW